MKYTDLLIEIEGREFGIRVSFESEGNLIRIKARSAYQIGDTIHFETEGTSLEALLEQVKGHFEETIKAKLSAQTKTSEIAIAGGAPGTKAPKKNGLDS